MKSLFLSSKKSRGGRPRGDAGSKPPNEPCESCKVLVDVPFALLRRKRPDGTFGPSFAVETKWCPSCGCKVKENNA
jgi:hypothetical protein